MLLASGVLLWKPSTHFTQHKSAKKTRPEVFRALRSSGKGLPSRRNMAIRSPAISTSESVPFWDWRLPWEHVFISSCCILLPQGHSKCTELPTSLLIPQRPLASGSTVVGCWPHLKGLPSSDLVDLRLLVFQFKSLSLVFSAAHSVRSLELLCTLPGES